MAEYLTDLADETRLQCRHIFTDGRRCGSPALRSPEGHEKFCYFHHNTRRPIQHAPSRKRRRSSFTLPNPEDRSAIQLALAEVLQKIAANEIDPRRAGLLLYGLQIASRNLPRPDPNARPKEPVCEVTHDPEHGVLAPPAELGHDEPVSSAQRILDELEALQQPEAKVEAQSLHQPQSELRHTAPSQPTAGLNIQATAASPTARPAPRSGPNCHHLKILRKKQGGGGTLISGAFQNAGGLTVA